MDISVGRQGAYCSQHGAIVDGDEFPMMDVTKVRGMVNAHKLLMHPRTFHQEVAKVIDLL